MKVKRSETLAIENAKRIAHQLRAERNEAVAMAQIRRDQAQSAINMCQRLIDGEDVGDIAKDLEALKGDLSSNSLNY